MSGDPEKVQVEIEEVPEVKEEPAPAPAPVEEPASAPAPVEEPVKAETAEVVKNVKEMLSSTEGKSVGDLENRVKVLEERLDNLISIFISSKQILNIDTNGAIKNIINNIF